MKMIRILTQVPAPLNSKSDALKQQDTTASWFVLSLIEREAFQKERGRIPRYRRLIGAGDGI